MLRVSLGVTVPGPGDPRAEAARAGRGQLQHLLP